MNELPVLFFILTQYKTLLQDDLPSKSQEGGIKRKGCINDTISHSDTQDGLNNNSQGVVKRKRADLLAEETLKQLEVNIDRGLKWCVMRNHMV